MEADHDDSREGNEYDDDDDNESYDDDEFVSTTQGSVYRDLDVEEEDSDEEFVPEEDQYESAQTRRRYDPELAELFSSNEDDDEDEDDEELLDQALEMENTGKRARKRPGPKGHRKRQLEPFVQQLIDQASQSFLEKDYDVAIELGHEAISADKEAQEAYLLLATIYCDREQWDKAMAAQIYAAYCNAQDYDTWRRAAELSEKLGHLQQACELYAGAFRADRSHTDIPVRRAYIFLQLNLPKRALKLMLRFRRMYFRAMKQYKWKSRALFNIAQALDQLDRRPEAIRMLEKLLEENLAWWSAEHDPSKAAQPDAEFGLQELSCLVELYYSQHTFIRAIRTLKKMTRWMKGRGDESWWDELKDDCEFDDRRFKVKKFTKSQYADDEERYKLPPDLRVLLLLCRLQVDKDFSEALHHVDIIKQLEPEKFQHVYIRAGKALQEKGLNQDALELLQTAERYMSAPDIELTYSIARCRQALCQYDEAEQLYIEILQRDPTNVDVMVAIAEVFTATGKMEQARVLIKEANRLRSLAASAQSQDTSQDQQILAHHDALNEANYSSTIGESFFYTEQERPATRLTRAQKQQREREQTILAQSKWQALQRFKVGVVQNNPVSISEWLRVADELISMFTAQKRFFIRAIIFQGGKGSIEERLERLTTSVNQEGLFSEGESESEHSEEADEKDEEADGSKNVRSEKKTKVMIRFRAILFTEWFDLFMEAALLHAKHDNVPRSYEIITYANACRLQEFISQSLVITLVHCSCAYLVGDAASASEAARTFSNSYQFYNDAYRLYYSLLNSGHDSMEVFNSTSNQKYYLRQIKAMDSILQKKPIVGAARVADADTTFEKPLPVLLVVYAHMMLLSRSYAPSLNYLTRAHELAANDPMILFSIGLVHVHRALQRLSTNRHLQVVQGLSYLQDYYKIQEARGGAYLQEANYNMGRVYQTLSLPTFAIRYYKKVLDAEPTNQTNQVTAVYDFRAEAAYNLSIIYILAGNPQASRAVIDKHIVI